MAWDSNYSMWVDSAIKTGTITVTKTDDATSTVSDGKLHPDYGIPLIGGKWYDEEYVDRVVKALNETKYSSIPIDWIYKWIQEIPSKDYDVNGQVKFVFYDKDKPALRIPCITDMIDDWRKEHGLN